MKVISSLGFLIFIVVHIAMFSPQQIIYIKNTYFTLRLEMVKNEGKTNRSISLRKRREARNWIFHNSEKILIPPIDTWQHKMEMYTSSKIQNCDVFEWCLHLNFIFLLLLPPACHSMPACLPALTCLDITTKITKKKELKANKRIERKTNRINFEMLHECLVGKR